MSEDWHAKEMRLAKRRKEAWLEKRGCVMTWLLEPFPVSLWLGSAQVGIVAGLISGAFLACSI